MSRGVRLPAPALVVPWPLHQYDPWEVVEKDRPDPPRHPVRPRRPEVPVDDDHREDDDDDVVDEGEEQVVGDQRNRVRCRRKDLGDEQQEDDESEQNGYAHGHLLAGVGGQVEDPDREERDEDARDNEVDRVEERLATDVQRVVGDRNCIVTVHVHHSQLTRTSGDVPRSTRHVVSEVDLIRMVSNKGCFAHLFGFGLV